MIGMEFFKQIGYTKQIKSQSHFESNVQIEVALIIPKLRHITLLFYNFHESSSIQLLIKGYMILSLSPGLKTDRIQPPLTNPIPSNELPFDDQHEALVEIQLNTIFSNSFTSG